MIQLSSITNAISNAAHSAAVHAKNLCVDSKVDSVFRTTVGAVQAHPYIAILGTGVAVYCCRGRIGGLVNKVKQAAEFLYTKVTASMTSLINLLRRSPVSLQQTSSSLQQTSSSQTNEDNPSLPTKKDEDSDSMHSINLQHVEENHKNGTEGDSY